MISQMESQGPSLDLLKTGEDYVEKLIKDIPGMKVMILDQETTSIVSLCYSFTQSLDKNIYLVDQIRNTAKKSVPQTGVRDGITPDPAAEQSDKMVHLVAVYIVRPTEENIRLIMSELEDPKYGGYYLYFTNVVRLTLLEKIASKDHFDVVRQVQEVFLDYYPINRRLFHLNMNLTLSMSSKPIQRWNALDRQNMNRMVDGLSAIILSTRKYPTIRYQKSSEVTYRLAEELISNMQNEHDLFNGAAKHTGNCILLILDRKEDPVTPLLNQWTYQAMVHELLGIRENRVDMSKTPGISSNLKNIVLSQNSDDFFSENIDENFGDLAMNIKDLVEKYKHQTNSKQNLDSLDDMQRFLEDYPEFRRLSNNVSKHVAICQELSRLAEERQLLSISEIEQDVACNDSRSEHFKAVSEIIKDPESNNLEKLRLTLLYALRYENDDKIYSLRTGLRHSGVSDNQIRLLDALLEYAGTDKRGGDLFNKKSFLAKAKSTWKSTFKGVPNVYTQHIPLMKTILDNLWKGQLKDADYPAITSHSNIKDKPTEVIVYFVGGTTYEEAREATNFKECPVIVGGDTILNSKTFLAELSQFYQSRGSDMEINMNSGSNSSGQSRFRF